jgi:aspartate oxidase
MIYDIICKHFDILIIGAGGSGLMSAISASDNGVSNIAIISKVIPSQSHTISAKGGINASLGNVVADDWKWHAYDTIKGGAGLADEDAVEILCKNATDAIIYLEKIGVVFSRNKNNLIDQRAYGGQTNNYGKGGVAYRACYSKDNTGQTIHNSLLQEVLKRNITILNDYFVYELLIENNKCYGCLAIDINEGKIIVLSAKSTILASGGYSQIYQNTTSSTICTGDGTALTFKAGLPLQDMEFVQFHPTGIPNLGFLITEACRGEGGFLLNNNHERFMINYAPQMMELASRDVISLAMGHEIAKGNGAGINQDHLWLDLRHLDIDIIKNKLPSVADLIKNFLKLDIKNDLIPVAPTAHYTMGGVACNIDCEVIEGLMAVGEVACLSVHGANRLGCNSLLDLIVFGKIAGLQAVKNIQNILISKKDLENLAFKIASKNLNKFYAKFSNNFSNTSSLSDIKLNLQKNNEKTLGIFRNHPLIFAGLEYKLKLWQEFNQYKITNDSLMWNNELIDYLELENLLINSLAVAFSALNRLESRGSHYRFDYPLSLDEFKFHSLVVLKDFEKFVMEFNLKKVNNTNKF